MSIFGRKRGRVRKIAAQFDALQSDLKALRRDAGQLANGVSRAAGTAVDVAEDTYDDVEKWTALNVGSMRDSVRNQPLAACLVSLGIGAVLGALFLRR